MQLFSPFLSQNVYEKRNSKTWRKKDKTIINAKPCNFSTTNLQNPRKLYASAAGDAGDI